MNGSTIPMRVGILAGRTRPRSDGDDVASVARPADQGEIPPERRGLPERVVV